jgi:hypothetical protein
VDEMGSPHFGGVAWGPVGMFARHHVSSTSSHISCHLLISSFDAKLAQIAGTDPAVGTDPDQRKSRQ